MALEGLPIFVSALARRLAVEATRYADPKIPSRTLRQAQTVLDRGGRPGRNVVTARFAAHIPHYWSVFVNDGHGVIRPRKANRLVWFKNPAKDPRFPGRVTPARFNRIGRLSRRQFLFHKRAGNIVIAKSSRAVEGVGFYDNEAGMRGFVTRANAVANREVRGYILDQLRREGVLRHQERLDVRI